MEWLESNAWAVWLGLALVLGAVEVATVDFVFLMLAGGALAGALAGVFAVGVTGQVAAAVIVAVALLAVVRPLAKRRLTDGMEDLQIGASAYVGEVGIVTETVTADSGRVRVDGEIWSARLADVSIPAAQGAQVHVNSIDGATLLVTAVPPIQDEITDEESP